MQDGGRVCRDESTYAAGCAFCEREKIAVRIMKETASFVLIPDHAPLVEGHLLIIPKGHYACYGEAPARLDTELACMKREVQEFFERYYAPAVFWEHGIFRQTVFHAHLHCFPFGETAYDAAEGCHGALVESQEDMRRWYAERGQYFYMENEGNAFLFAPEVERYLHIIQDVLRHGVVARNGQAQWRSPQERLEKGLPMIEAVMARWERFQGVKYADTTGA